MANGRDYDLYLLEQRRKGQAFENAVQDAKRELYPELFFSDFEPSVTLCRVCGGEGFHKESCKLRSPDGKAKPLIEDLLAEAGDKEKEKKSLIEVERERLKALDLTPEKAEKVKKAVELPAPEAPKE